MKSSILTETEFETPSFESWLALARKALRGADFEEKLISRTEDGIRLDPLYDRRSDAVPMRGKAEPGWAVVQRVDDPDPDRANRQALVDVDGGASGLALIFAGAPNAFGYGLPPNKEAMAKALEGVSFDRTYIRIDVHPNYRGSADWLIEYLGSRRVNPEKISLSFGIDPAARFAGTGQMRVSIEALEASMPQSLAGFFALGIPAVLIEADGRVYHNGGATAAQELGAMVATAVSHMRMFETARQPLVYSVPHIGFSVAATQDQFETMAKLRALRLLWQKVQEECGIEPSDAHIHAETSFSMMTKKDPETNILRSTIAAFAAATGGADSLSVLPYTISHGLPDNFARRIARNTQLVLADEAGVGLVKDPAAGSGMIEHFTDALCEAAWNEFVQIEKEGGMLASLRDGLVQGRIAEKLQKRLTEVAQGKKTLLGTNLFPVPAEKPVNVLDAPLQSFEEEVQLRCNPIIPVRWDAPEERAA